ncbi:MAG: hypothetical protein OXU36_19310 [Candidatus Poribacteria bacterium]|nr:hypothetical protein [Candidatus Poribacteria bacterium]MYH80519.1 hypothetical protein [Candidatus Poribacteria bacterium]
MKQLTDAEKQELETKIQKEKERQQALRETNPDLPETFEEASAKTGIFRKFALRRLWKYGFLVIVFGLLAFSVINLIGSRDFGYDQYGGLVIGLVLLFNHIAYYFTTKGWKSVVMKTVAWVWIAFGLVYILWLFR